MTVLTIDQVAGLAIGAGFTGEDAATITAIAWAESRFDSAARGDVGIQTSKWGPSIGLTQIRSLKADTGKGTQRDEVANLDPATNMRHAHEIFQSGGWTPWSTYTSGSYRAKMAEARAAVAKGGDTSGIPAGGAAPAGTTDPTAGLAFFTDPGLWARVGAYLLGGVVLLFGIWKLTGAGFLNPTRITSTVKKAVKA